MGITRRQVIVGQTSWPVLSAIASAQGRRASGPRARSTPPVCIYSQALIQIPYDELVRVLRGMGADGCDLSVQPDGHVDPAKASVDLMRAIEAVTGVGLDVPVITTSYTSIADPTIRLVVAVCGEMGIPVFRVGHWKYTEAAEPEARLIEAQRDIAGLASLARAAGMAMAIQNVAGENVGAAIWDINMAIRGMDPAVVGYDFDIGYATAEGAGGGWSVAMRLVRPRLKKVTLRDFVWSKDASGKWKALPCPPGEGAVDFPRFFAMLARARFTGPISLPLDYQPKDEVNAMRRDIEFVRKHIAAAYGG
jgi:sugar phosphate isomerase/epimerase